jgi:eukaryotic-like serine/threonine-protein kinase
MHEVDGESYRVVRHRGAHGEVDRAIVDDGTGAAELLVIPLGARAAWEPQVIVMGACPSPHLPAVRDVALDPDGTLRLVRSLVSGQRVDTLLATPGWCTPGRAVTLLHPIVSTVAAAHELGSVLGGPDESRICITADGCPVIADLSGAFRAAALPPTLRRKDPAHLTDIQALEALRSSVIRALDTSGFSDVAASLPDVSDALTDPDVLLRWCAAEPLVGAAPVAGSAPAGGRAVVEPATPQGSALSPAAGVVARVVRQVGLPSAISSLVESATSDVAERAQGIRQAASRLSRRALVAAAAGVALVAAMVITAVLPSSPDGGLPDAAEATMVDTESGAQWPQPVAAEHSGPGEDPTLESDPENWIAVAGDLVKRWQSCARDQRLLCDDALHTASHAAESRATAQDAVLTSLVALLEADGVDVAVLERSGDAVVLSLHAADTTPASLLTIRS